MHHPDLPEVQKRWPSTLKAYLTGLLLSLVLTLVSFGLVSAHLLEGHLLALVLITLAGLQAAVQLVLFLHVGKDPKPQWGTLIFFFMFLVLLIIVVGSLWIMHDLDNRVMSNMMPH